MPLYEYVSKEDGSVIELLRSAKDADAPVADPQGKGRTFVRKLSTFASASATGTGTPSGGGCCPCGKNRGSCGSNS